MTASPGKPTALLADMAETFRQVFRSEAASFMRQDLPPSDTEAEANTIRGMLSGRVTVDDLGALQGKHFFTVQYGALFELLRETTDPQALYMGLMNEGYGAGASVLIAELTELPNEPCLSREHLSMAACRLVELWRARHLSQRLRVVAAQVECGAVAASESAQLLREVYKDIR